MLSIKTTAFVKEIIKELHWAFLFSFFFFYYKLLKNIFSYWHKIFISFYTRNLHKLFYTNNLYTSTASTSRLMFYQFEILYLKEFSVL